jgi:hypothetical protein
MAAPPPPPPPLLVFNFGGLPAELQNRIWAHVHAPQNPLVVHHYFRLNCHGTRGRSGRRGWKMPRGYVSVDPFHRTINDNRFAQANDPDLKGLPYSLGLYYHKIRLPDKVCGRRNTMTHATRWHNSRYRDQPTTFKPASVYVNWHRDVFYFSNAFSYADIVR